MVRFLVSANQQDILFATFALIEGQTYLLVKVMLLFLKRLVHIKLRLLTASQKLSCLLYFTE